MFTVIALLAVCSVCLFSSASGAEGVEELNGDSFVDVLKEGDYIVVFFAPWCHYCHELMPILKRVAEERGGEVNCDKNSGECAPLHFAKFNCEDANYASNKRICYQYGVRAYPTIKLHKKSGQVISYLFQRSYDGLITFINQYLKGAGGDDEAVTR